MENKNALKQRARLRNKVGTVMMAVKVLDQFPTNRMRDKIGFEVSVLRMGWAKKFGAKSFSLEKKLCQSR